MNQHAQPDPAFWRGRKVFLTGHTGFKGGWLALGLPAVVLQAAHTRPGLAGIGIQHPGHAGVL